MYNNGGKQLKQFDLSGNKGSVAINASSFAPGFYYYSLLIDGKNHATKKTLLVK
ncbi:MAG TPA: hypothetical protein VFW07_12745 [Parafilimonas sp.]|nr:hypothetical protein [Parafilimonas sp.]